MSKATNENYIIRIKSYIDQFDSEGNTKEGKVIKAMSELLGELAEAVDAIEMCIRDSRQADRRSGRPGLH